MFKYLRFKEVVTSDTTISFRAIDDSVKVHHFDVKVVALEGDESAIDVLIENQPKEIECKVITKDEFKDAVCDSAQINRIRTVVKERIASKYSIADEIAMAKRSNEDNKKVEYDLWVNECIQKGRELKAIFGY